MSNNFKLNVAKEIAKRVKNGQTIGFGSGSTAELAVKEIAARVSSENLSIKALPTSTKIASLAAECGIEVLELKSGVKPDWAFDGADEVDSDLNLIKGGGGCHLMEKIVAKLSGGIVVIVGEDKLSKNLGEKFLVPVEFIPEAQSIVKESLSVTGAKEISLRESKSTYGGAFTEKGNYIFDVSFSQKITPELESNINSITGVVENGLFFGLTKEVIVGSNEGIKVLKP